MHIVRDITDRRRARSSLARALQVARRDQRPGRRPRVAPGRRAICGTVPGSEVARADRRGRGGVQSSTSPEARVLATRAIEFRPGAVRALTRPLVRTLTRDTLPGQRRRLPGDPDELELDPCDADGSQLRRHPTRRGRHGAQASRRRPVRRHRLCHRGGALRHVGHRTGRNHLGSPPRRAGDVRQPRRRLAAPSPGRGRTGAQDRAGRRALRSLGGHPRGRRSNRDHPARRTPLGRLRSAARRPNWRAGNSLELVHPDDREKTASPAWRNLRRARSITDFVNRQRHRDGSYRLIEWRDHALGGRAHLRRRSRHHRKGGGARRKRRSEGARRLRSSAVSAHTTAVSSRQASTHPSPSVPTA